MMVARQRSQRQSRIELASEIGINKTLDTKASLAASASSGSLHSLHGVSNISSSGNPISGLPDSSAAGSANSICEDSGRTCSGLGTGSGVSSTGGGSSVITTYTGEFSTRSAMTERRRLQLERIRAMTCELKPDRGSGGGRRGSRGTRSRRPFRGTDQKALTSQPSGTKERGRGRWNVKKLFFI
ncbi:unnamed protein product [Protopolystoma xenopodis]|uniref:Uncharacterized protein n=1 Tax=Protopolystoma xenopodis TaxID=117903 RepID=A0A448WQ02_9PLAT|nr:unnamed protein product [Protopolystoma xenopodis]